MDKGEVTFEQNANQVTVKLEDCQIYHRGRHMVFLGDTCNSDEIKEVLSRVLKTFILSHFFQFIRQPEAVIY